jgi:hypothetical protein
MFIGYDFKCEMKCNVCGKEFEHAFVSRLAEKEFRKLEKEEVVVTCQGCKNVHIISFDYFWADEILGNLNGC